MSHNGFILNLRRDDGAAVYINGVELVRSNLPAGVLTHTTMGPNAADNGNTIFSFPISSTMLVAGNNTIAVEIHQTTAASTDLSFDLEFQLLATK